MQLVINLSQTMLTFEIFIDNYQFFFLDYMKHDRWN